MHYSASFNTFFPDEYREAYEASGRWPNDAILVTGEEYATYAQGQPPAGMQRGADESGRPTWVALPPSTLEEVSAAATSRVNEGYQAQMGQILDEYPEAETLSFDKQEREARTWSEWQEVGGGEPATPYIDAMLVERPIGKAELVSRIIIKADAFMAAHGGATGKRQRLEDDIKAAVAAEDRAALEAIDW